MPFFIYSNFGIQLFSLVLQLTLQLHFTATVKNAYADYCKNAACKYLHNRSFKLLSNLSVLILQSLKETSPIP